MSGYYARIVQRILLWGGFFLFFIFGIAFSYSVKSSKVPIDTSYNSVTAQDISNLYSSLPEYSTLDAQVNRFINQWGITGASVAIAKNDRLIYAKGFGYSNREEGEEMQPYHIMRIASVSKLISAVAVMSLVEEGQLKLDTRVFGPKGILNDICYQNYIDPRIEDITVRHLLSHSAGWTTRWGDHLFMHQSIARQLELPLPITQDHIITFALTRRLHYTPGNHSSYNNLGYVILEKVIEKVSGRSYERFVQERVFAPLFIADAFIGYNYDSLRYPLEVRYYEVPEAQPMAAFDGSQQLVFRSRGGNDIRTLGAAGGWVMSAVSLAKFLMALESNSPENRIISRASTEMLEQSAPGIHPLGWRWVSSTGKKVRTGSFSGTSALSVANNDGLIYVFLTNSSPWVGSRFPYEADRFLNRTFNTVKEWPDIDILNPDWRLNRQRSNPFPFNILVNSTFPSLKQSNCLVLSLTDNYSPIAIPADE